MLAYIFVPEKLKNIILAFGSAIFLYQGIADSPQAKIYILLFVITIFVNYIVGQFIEMFRKSSKVWLVTGILFNFVWLIFFKYTGFIIDTINVVFVTHFTVKNIALPLGISFYTFQNVSYIVDVYEGRTKSEKNIFNYFLYISMFPQFTQGPVIRYGQIARQIRQRPCKPSADGLKTFIIGLGYKVLLADQIGKLWKDIGNIGFESISPKLAWLGIIAYSLKIYFDFQGYSLMAIGLGRMMGFIIPKNFDNPYLSVTMTEFWRKWHITLGTWFRDYVYIPLGGSRKGGKKLIRNTLIVWLFTGLWHGASWNFILWGFVLFVIMITEKIFTKRFMEKFRFIGHLTMAFLIPVTWLIFAVTDFHDLGIYFSKILPFFSKTEYYYPEKDYVKYLGIYGKYFIAGFILLQKFPKNFYLKLKKEKITSVALAVILIASVYCICKGKSEGFMYFVF